MPISKGEAPIRPIQFPPAEEGTKLGQQTKLQNASRNLVKGFYRASLVRDLLAMRENAEEDLQLNTAWFRLVSGYQL